MRAVVEVIGIAKGVVLEGERLVSVTSTATLEPPFEKMPPSDSGFFGRGVEARVVGCFWIVRAKTGGRSEEGRRLEGIRMAQALIQIRH